MQKHLPLLLIVTVYWLIGALFAYYTPAWQAPDEPAHYNYVRQLADGRLPVMALGDYDEAYRNQLISAGFPPEYDISIVTYEDWQPPLYYLLQTPIYLLTNGALLPMRLFSLFLGTAVVIVAYAVARCLFPQRPWLAWLTAVFVAFVPQHMAILASVNNDALSELLIALILYELLRWSMRPTNAPAPIWRMGILLGLGFLTKGTVYLMAPLLAVALLVAYWRQGSLWFRQNLRLFLPAFLLGSLWWVRNIWVYGGLDVLGKTRHDAVVVGQLRTAEWIDAYGLFETGRRLIETTFNSFWGQFGWMALPMLHPGWLYPLLWLLVATAVAGLLLLTVHTRWARQQHQPTLLGALPWPQIGLLALLFLLTVGLHVGYNLTFVQHQGRYLFPAMIPIGLACAVGWGSWAVWLLRPWPAYQEWLLKLLPIGVAVAFVGLDLYAVFRIILPNL